MSHILKCCLGNKIYCLQVLPFSLLLISAPLGCQIQSLSWLNWNLPISVSLLTGTISCWWSLTETEWLVLGATCKQILCLALSFVNIAFIKTHRIPYSAKFTWIFKFANFQPFVKLFQRTCFDTWTTVFTLWLQEHQWTHSWAMQLNPQGTLFKEIPLK